MNIANSLNSLCGSIAPGMCRISMSGHTAVKTSSGYKYYDFKTNRLVNCNNFAMDIGSDFFFALPSNQVTRGDLILVNGKPVMVLASNENTIQILNFESNAVENILPERHFFMGNMYFFSKIITPFGGKGGMKNMLRLQFMTSMMSQMGGGSSMFPGVTSNADGSHNNNFMQSMMGMMVMQNMFGGNGGGDFFSDIFSEFDGIGDQMGNMFSGMFDPTAAPVTPTPAATAPTAPIFDPGSIVPNPVMPTAPVSNPVGVIPTVNEEV